MLFTKAEGLGTEAIPLPPDPNMLPGKGGIWMGGAIAGFPRVVVVVVVVVDTLLEVVVVVEVEMVVVVVVAETSTPGT